MEVCEISHLLALAKCNCFVLLQKMLVGVCQIVIDGRSCFLEILDYWLEFLITEDIVNGESSICILAHDSCQFCLVFDHFYILNIVTSSELDCILNCGR